MTPWTIADIPDDASFRDPEAVVVHRDGRVYRSLSPEARRNWRAFRDSRVGSELLGSGLFVRTDEVANGTDISLEHARLPFISYPYEWSFDMLRDAALLTLDVMSRLLREDFILKDASAFNVQFVGNRPVFIDVASVVRFSDEHGWIAYAQFLEHFVYPLLVTAVRAVPFQPLLRAYPDGLPLPLVRALVGWADARRPGVLGLVVLRELLTKKTGGGRRPEPLDGVRIAKHIVARNVAGLAATVRKLRMSEAGSAWTDYTSTCSYTEDDRALKTAFVARALESTPGVVWDLGANTGEFTREASRHARHVVAVEQDHVAANRLYLRTRQEGLDNVNVVVDDIVNPAPALGFRLKERKPLRDRSTPDLVLSLALVHHVVLTRSVPLEMFARWMGETCGRWVVEFVDPDDPMASALRRAKRGSTHPYSRDRFEAIMGASFRILDRVVLRDSPRSLYLLALECSR